MSQIDEQAIKDRLTKTCTCRVVTKATIKEAIAKGADTPEKVKIATGAMAGCCNGYKCRARIEDLIEEIHGQKELV